MDGPANNTRNAGNRGVNQNNNAATNNTSNNRNNNVNNQQNQNVESQANHNGNGTQNRNNAENAQNCNTTTANSQNDTTSRNSNDNNNSTDSGVPVNAKGYINFRLREDIDLHFMAHEQIGNGTFGRIHRIRYQGQDMALKIVYQDPDYCNRELDLLEDLRNNANIIHLVFSYFTRFEGKIYLNLITEYLSHTLFTKIYDHRAAHSQNRRQERGCSRRTSSRNQQAVPELCMPMVELKNTFRGIFQGLVYMHSKQIAHRDLKPENIGYSFTGTVKIIDMGSAKKLLARIRNSSEVCTLLYRAPELLLDNQDYTCNIDNWAVGCILVETIIATPMFFEQNASQILREIMRVLGKPDETLLRNTRARYLEFIRTRAPINVDVRANISAFIRLPANVEHERSDLLDLLCRICCYSNRIEAIDALDMAFLADTPQIRALSNRYYPGDGGNLVKEDGSDSTGPNNNSKNSNGQDNNILSPQRAESRKREQDESEIQNTNKRLKQ